MERVGAPARENPQSEGKQLHATRRRLLTGDTTPAPGIHFCMIRKLKSGEYRLYSRKTDKSTGKRRNLGTFPSLEKAKKHEQEIQYFKKH